MADNIPDGITRQHILSAIKDFTNGYPHKFGPSVKFDLLHQGKRYPPKAILGLAARYVTGKPLTPYDFKGGEKSKNFRVLKKYKFEIVSKDGVEKPVPPQRNVAGFIIQGNPKYYEIDLYFARQKYVYWKCPKLAWAFELGQPVFFKRSGDGGGIVAFGNVVELPQDVSLIKHPEFLGDDLWTGNADPERIKVGIQLSEVRPTVSEGMIPTKVLEAIPELAGHPVATVRRGTNFRLSPEHLAAVMRLWSGDEILAKNTGQLAEGRRLETKHYRIERNSVLVKLKKDSFADKHGYLKCEVCGFRYDENYPIELASGFIEAHHIKPLATLDSPQITSLEDLILVCANCHRMIHRTNEAESNLATLQDHFQ